MSYLCCKRIAVTIEAFYLPHVPPGSILKKLLHTGNSFKVSECCSDVRIGRINVFQTNDVRHTPITHEVDFGVKFSEAHRRIHWHAPICSCVDPLWGDPSLPAVAAGPKGQLCRGAVPYLRLSGPRIPCCALLQRTLYPRHHHLQPLLQPPWWCIWILDLAQALDHAKLTLCYW